MEKTINEKTFEEIEHVEILKSDEKSLRASEFLNTLTEMIINYSQSVSPTEKMA